LVVGSVGGNGGRGSRKLHRFRFGRAGVPVAEGARAATRAGLRRSNPGKPIFFVPRARVPPKNLEKAGLSPLVMRPRESDPLAIETPKRAVGVWGLCRRAPGSEEAQGRRRRTVSPGNRWEWNARPSQAGRTPWGGDRTGRERRKAPAARLRESGDAWCPGRPQGRSRRRSDPGNPMGAERDETSSPGSG